MAPNSSITVDLPSSKPLRIYVPAGLRSHGVQVKTFLSRHKQYTDVAVSIFIFHPRLQSKAEIIELTSPSIRTMVSNAPYNTPIDPPQLLILQCIQSRSLPDNWELPGGAADKLEDRSLLHSAVKRTFEMTGLHIKRFVRQIGDGEDFRTSEGKGLRLSFEVEVAEPEPNTCVQVDTHKYQDVFWALEEDVEGDIFPLVKPEQKEVILQAFALRIQDAEERRELAVRVSREQREAEQEQKQAGPRASFEGGLEEDEGSEEDEGEVEDEEGQEEEDVMEDDDDVMVEEQDDVMEQQDDYHINDKKEQKAQAKKRDAALPKHIAKRIRLS